MSQARRRWVSRNETRLTIMTNRPTILITDDSEMNREILKEILGTYYRILEADNGATALEVLRANPGGIDLLLLDINMPVMDGMEVCQQAREFTQVPIVMVTAKGEDMDKIMGLEYGADDYITKPFNILELKARIKAILRRSARRADEEAVNKNELRVRDLVLHTDSRRAEVNGREVNLTAKEFDLLQLLMENPGKVYSRDSLLDTIWGFAYPGDVRTVDVHIRRLREKIEETPGDPKYIITKWGVGYYLD